MKDAFTGEETADGNKQRVYFAPTEFKDNNDYLGMFNRDPEPSKFFCWERSVEHELDSNFWLVYEVVLDEKEMKNERQVYTFFALLGDLGGFNGAIVVFPAYLMNIYSQSQYKSAVLAEFPVRPRRKKRPRRPSQP